MVEPARDFEVPLHVVWIHDEPVHELAEQREHVVHEGARVGENHALDGRMADVALVPQRDVLQCSDRVAAHEAREAAEFFAGDRVALVRHRGTALLAWRKVFLHFEHFGPLQVPELGGPAINRGCDEREHGVKFRMAVALHDLRRERRGREAESLADIGFHVRIEVRMRADCAADFPHADARLHLLQALERAAKFVIHQRELQPERDRLRVDAVAAADHRRHLEFLRTLRDHLAQFAEILQQNVRRLRGLHGERGVEHVAARHALVHPAARGADVARDVLQERDHVVIRALFDLHDLR